MNKHLLAFLIKFAGTFSIILLILGFSFQMSFIEILLLSVVLGAGSYLIGDLYILLRTNKTVGLIADFILVWTVTYLFASWSPVIVTPFSASLLTAIGISLYELFFHTYVESYVLPDKRKRATKIKQKHLRYQTEIAEELDPED